MATSTPVATPTESRGLKGRDLISIGIYTAIYFVLNFAFMLIGGFHPLLWLLMPAFIALTTGIPFMLMCAKVPKPFAVLIMGMIPSLIYFATGMFTPLILGMMIVCCIVAELVRLTTRYQSFAGNTVAFALFSLGMTGSPLPVWLFHDSFFAQISSQGMSADYVATLQGFAGVPMMVVMFAATIVCAILGALIARKLFKKHFEKAGLV